MSTSQDSHFSDFVSEKGGELGIFIVFMHSAG